MFRAAYSLAREEPAGGLRAGRHAGRDAGGSEGRAIGSRRGQVEGEAAAVEVETVSLAGSGRRESEGDVGGGRAYSGNVLVVGDSLEVLSAPYLEHYLPSVDLTINVVGGYSSIQIFELFEASYDPSHSVIVFDAGTNDNPAYPEILASNLQAVAETVGDRCMVVPTIHGFTVDGVDSSGKNRVVRNFAAGRPGTQVPDWANVVATRPDLMQSDNLHPTVEGADYRAQIIAQGVKGCIEFDSLFAGG